MADIDDPFCPLPRDRLYFNLVNEKDKIEKIIERIQTTLNDSNTQEKNSGSVIGAALSSGYCGLNNSAGGRLIILTCNNCNKGYASSNVRDCFNNFNTENEKDLYNPQVINSNYTRMNN